MGQINTHVLDNRYILRYVLSLHSNECSNRPRASPSSPIAVMWTLVQKRQIRKEVERTRLPSHRTSKLSQAEESQKQEQASTGTPSHHDSILVECTSPSDTLDPHNWPLARRLTALCILCLLVFTQAWAGSSASLAHDKAAAQFAVCSVGMNLSTAAYLFGIGSGSLFTGPLSETGGRTPVYLLFSFAFLLFQLGVALSKTFEGVVVCRYFVGLASSGALGINGASVGDLFDGVERTMWFPVVAWVNVVRKWLNNLGFWDVES